MALNGIVVKFSKRSPLDSIKDTDASAAVDKQFNSKNAGKFMKKLFDDSPLHKAIVSKQNESYRWHINHTFPLMDGGFRICDPEFSDSYLASISGFKSEIAGLVSKFEPEYQAAIQADLARLAGLGNPTDYPPWEEMKERYGIDAKVMMPPSQPDFRFKVAEQMQKDYDEMIEQSKIAGRKELFARATKVVTTLKESCEKENTRRHESSLTNIQDLADVMGILNVHDDAEIRYLIEELKQVIAGVSIWDLRNSDVVRSAVAERCGKFLRQIDSGGFVAPEDLPVEEVPVLDEPQQVETSNSLNDVL